MNSPRYSPNSRCLFTELRDGTAVLLHLDTKFYYTLNPTGVVVWKGLSEAVTLDEIVNRIVSAFETDETTARSDIQKLLTELVDEELVEATS
ncbi:MAG TPA: PqqD family protein [Polyangiaceae bacterium]|nr:MAG: hypothetical protein BWY17_02637 [Deltaproteobacteria bacterium ADurb.Bin207]HNS96713.1 PqqD family protein [Polyangiaceae bacterium]HNZ22422.1 PqqD family protein [Polyangiaceae bacterium]HOD20957.1 PqqD family protein [Polyangiaceae bacterium]HOE48316.1 PqqD family protein [Polyangiaceae bacterium]